MGKLGCLAKTPSRSVTTPLQFQPGIPEQLERGCFSRTGNQADLAKSLRKLLGLLICLFPPGIPGINDRREHLVETRHSHPLTGWPVGPSKKGFSVRCQEDRHRPATPATDHLHGVHVDLVKIRSLLAVYLDRDKMVIERASDRFILEALVLHHVAPVAC